ncbi:SDR family oxidoreductase [Streptomyces sp. NPDC102415]|uniref:SDR family oxidoreductase n=1 Tax=Streptomyces sp. NPDC102415 TaxID=3366173 RepID=UPI00382E35F0
MQVAEALKATPRRKAGDSRSSAHQCAGWGTDDAIQESGGQAVPVQGVLTNVADVRRLFDTAVDIYGGADIAVITTGMVMRKPILQTTEEDYDRMFGINAKAA